TGPATSSAEPFSYKSRHQAGLGADSDHAALDGIHRAPGIGPNVIGICRLGYLLEQVDGLTALTNKIARGELGTRFCSRRHAVSQWSPSGTFVQRQCESSIRWPC